MIIYDLKCNNEHIFEAWFDDSSSFQKQLKKKLVKCPFCDSNKVTKSIMSPNISSKSNSSSKIKQRKKDIFANYSKNIEKIKKDINLNFEYVGKDFIKKARKMHYGEVSEKPIYGEASEGEAKELVKEGIDLVRLPWFVDKKNKN